MKKTNAIARWTHWALGLTGALAIAVGAAAQPPQGGPGPQQGGGPQGGPPPAFGQGGGPGGGQHGQGGDMRRALGGPQLMQRMLQAMDKDGDLIVTRQEYDQAAEERFSRMDRNQDGVLDAQDAPQQGQGMGTGGQEGGARGIDTEMFSRLDTDGDGKVSAGEWKGPERVFQHIDADRDGLLSQEEAANARPPRRPRGQGGPRQGGQFGQAPGDIGGPESAQGNPQGQGQQLGRGADQGQAMLERLFECDANKDGQISSDEFKGPEERFARMDANGDGLVTREEVSQKIGRGGRQRGGQGAGGGNLLARLDANKDGKVSRDEFPGRDEIFQRLDSNGDGTIDEQEVAQLAQRRQGGRGQGRPGPAPAQ